MDWLSLLLVVFIAVLVVRAWRNGIVREFVALGALIIAVPIASTFYGDLVPKVEPIVDNLKLANLVAFLAIVFGKETRLVKTNKRCLKTQSNVT